MPDMFRNVEFKRTTSEELPPGPLPSNRYNGSLGAVDQPLKSDYEAGWESLVEEVKQQLRKGVASEIKADYDHNHRLRKQPNLLELSPPQENGFHELKQEHSLPQNGNTLGSIVDNPAGDTDDIDVQVLWAAAVVELAKKEAEVRRLKEQVDDLQAVEIAAEEMMGVLEKLSSASSIVIVEEQAQPAAVEPFNHAKAESAIQKLDPSSALRECLSLALKNGHGKLVEDAAAEAAALADRNQINARAADAALQLAKSAVASQLNAPAGKADTTVSKIEDMVRQRPWCASTEPKHQSLKQMKQESLNRQTHPPPTQKFASFDGWTQF